MLATTLAVIGTRVSGAAVLASVAEIGITALMRSADARLSASTMISSSMRFSLVGAQVDCTTKHRGHGRFVDFDGDFTVGEATHAGCARVGCRGVGRFQLPCQDWHCR